MSEWYAHFLRPIVSALFFVLPLLILLWAVWRWLRSPSKIVDPVWRSYVAFAAIALAGASSLLWVVSIIWARVIGGFPYYDSTLLTFYRWGGWTSLVGLLVSFVGKGKLRWPACGLAALMTFLWFAAAMGE